MKKTLSMILAVLLALSAAAGAAAENDKPLSELCDAAFELQSPFHALRLHHGVDLL